MERSFYKYSSHYVVVCFYIRKIQGWTNSTERKKKKQVHSNVI